jgi:hypothetical protein
MDPNHFWNALGMNTWAWRQVMRDALSLLRRASKLTWVVRRAAMALVLFGLIWGVDQANEYLDNILFLCDSGRKECATSLGMRVTLTQFALLSASVLWFAFLVRDTALIALRSATSWNEGRGRYLTGFATALGSVPLLVFSYRALAATGYAYEEPLLLPALVGIVVLGGMTRAALRLASEAMRLGLGSLFVAAIVIVSLSPLTPRFDLLLVIVGAVFFSTVLLKAAGVAGCGQKYRVPTVAFSVTAGTLLALKICLIAIRASDRAHVLGVAIALLLPLVLLVIPASVSAPTPAHAHDVADAVPAGPWRYFQGLSERTVKVYLPGLVLTALGLGAANGMPDVTANYLLAPATLTLGLSAAGLSYVLLAALFGRPAFWCAVVVFVMISWANIAPPAPLAAAEQSYVRGDCHDLGTVCPMDDRIWERYQRWAAQPGRGDNDPIILVAAAGGGSRAAAHTASSLAAVDEATCGAFGDHVFAISGVSGGAIGSLLYAASRVDAFGPAERERCRQTKPGERAYPLVNGLLTAASADHLSPVLLRGMGYDLIQGRGNASRIDGSAEQTDFATRAGALQTSWFQRYQAFLRSRKIKDDGNALLHEERLRNDAQPLLVFNASSVQDGHRVLLSYPLLCPRDGWCAQQMSLLTDATDSARFPLVSPARARNVFHTTPWQDQVTVSERAIVDGGYFDNSGGQTILDIASALERHGIPLNRIFVVLITSDPDEGLAGKNVPDYAASGWLTQLAVPVRSLVMVRDGRTAIALNDMEQRLGPCNVIHWSMSPQSLNPSLPALESSLKADPATVALSKLHQDTGRTSLDDIRHAGRAPALGWALSDRSANGLLILAHAHGLPYDGGRFRYENELLLASRLHYNNDADQAVLDNDLMKSRCRGPAH